MKPGRTNDSEAVTAALLAAVGAVSPWIEGDADTCRHAARRCVAAFIRELHRRPHDAPGGSGVIELVGDVMIYTGQFDALARAVEDATL